ncbi:hypothetical protein ACLQ2R_34860 [Streptosporangium sp. DT93]|uniref:hypothetical protein n=1 Tax=Streptosporangium sp. DT93 TaxID=3393428 RepID=UPI003CF540DA
MSSGHSEGPSTNPDDWRSPHGAGAGPASGDERLSYDRERFAQGRPPGHAGPERTGAFGHGVSPYDDRTPDDPPYPGSSPYGDPAHTSPAYPEQDHGAPTRVAPDHGGWDHIDRGHDRGQHGRTYTDHDHATGGYGDTAHPGTGYPGTGYGDTGHGDAGHSGTGYPGTGYGDMGRPGAGHAAGEYAGDTRLDHAAPHGYEQPHVEQPHAPRASPATESVRTHAIIVMVVGIVLSLSCFLSIGGLAGAVLSGMALGRVDSDTRGAGRLLRWAWIGIGANIGLIVLGAAVFVVAGLNHAFGP